MKVFSWVNRRFAHGNTGIASFKGEKVVERNGKSKVNIEMHSLLEQEIAFDVLDGILSIGTFAIGPLETAITVSHENVVDLYNETETDNLVNMVDELDDVDVESMPLMKKDSNGSGNPCKGMVKQVEGEYKIENNYNESEKELCEMKKRVTLADLFLEERVKLGSKVLTNYHEEDCFAKGNSKIKPISHTKNGLSKAKKLLKEELHPVKKLNQLMKRMTKKKIHPETIEEGTHKDTQKKPTKAMSISGHYHELHLAATDNLLHLQGCSV